MVLRSVLFRFGNRNIVWCNKFKMCTIVNKRKSNKNVFIHFHNDEDMFAGIRKISIKKYMYALDLCGGENPDFLFEVSRDTSDRDIVESYNSVVF